ncbi:MAG: deoxyguanosinetriphosphate triphosphohydrolase [Micrococcales bacterium 73-13]|nr:MAG: deoxyguanosinetriphosphate triphosphohydrolase [Micrococcales bacterium 73-13]
MPPGYAEPDAQRRLPEAHDSRRSDFARDRARILHSSALRRLAAKTQVLSPAAGLDFARNRLTHSLEVAQIGRELGGDLGLDPDVVDAACLGHDLGHPPFGHNGERALNDWAAGIGGFEGNAQTLRMLTRLEPKVFGPDGAAYGVNLTRASLDATCKYPWGADRAVEDPSGRRKFGHYADDAAAFDWLRQGAPVGRLCIEAQVMDLADDIAYSVHDFEDAIVEGYIEVRELGSRADHDALVDGMLRWIGGEFGPDELRAAFERLDSIDAWITDWDGTRQHRARLKNLASRLIGRFVGAAQRATREAHPQTSLARYGADLVVPAATRAEIAVLKGIVGSYVMANVTRQPVYVRQRAVLTELADRLLSIGPGHLDIEFQGDWIAAPDDAGRRRVVVDQIASLTDQNAMTWHSLLVAG